VTVKEDKFDLYIDISTTVIKSSFRTLRLLIWEKCKVEVSSAADGQEVLAERADGAGWTVFEGLQRVVLFDQWKEWSKRQTRAVVSRAVKDVARNNHENSRMRVERGGGVNTAFRAAPTQGALFFFAPVTVNEGRGDDAIPLKPEGAILYDPMMLTVLDPEGSESGVAAGLCHVSTQTGSSHAPALASGMATPCWSGSLLPALEGVTDKFGNLEGSVLRDQRVVEWRGLPLVMETLAIVVVFLAHSGCWTRCF